MKFLDIILEIIIIIMVAFGLVTAHQYHKKVNTLRVEVDSLKETVSIMTE